MLILQREVDEIVTVGDDVEIIVVGISGGKVRLGVTAPPEMPVHRKEIRDAILAGHRTEEQRAVDRKA